MTQIRPFCGLRPVPEYAAEIAALPYDVMDTEAVSYTHLTLPTTSRV